MQIVYIDIIPQKEKPIVNLSQYDNDRIVRFMLLENGEEYTLSGTETIDVNIKKPDGNIVVINPTVTANKYVDVLFTEQSTACHGKSFGEISIKENSTIIGTCNFIMDVEKSPTCGGIESASEIANLTQQIEDITQEVIGDDYYNKIETDALLADKADVSDLPDMSLYYTKTATDTLLNAKADKSDTYTKAQVDSALAAKANSSDLATVATTGDYDDLINKPVLPDMTQYYTKSEVNAIVDDIFPTFTTSGDIASFITALNKPLVSVTADPLATEITRCGKNLCYAENSDLFPQGDNLTIDVNPSTHTAYVRCVPNTTIYFRKINATNRTYFYGCNDVPAINVIVHELSYTEISTNVYAVNSGTYTYIALYYSNESAENIMACYNQSDLTAYAPYNGTTKPIADATTITTLSGVNNVFADTGSVTVQYKYMSM